MIRSTGQAYGTQEHYIDGAFRASASAETFESLNPATNEALALASAGQAEDVDLAVAAARRAFDDGPWPRLKAAERAAALRRIAAGITAHTNEFIAREVADIGMPVAQMKGLAARAARELRVLRRRRRPSCTGAPSRSATSFSTTRSASRSGWPG